MRTRAPPAATSGRIIGGIGAQRIGSRVPDLRASQRAASVQPPGGRRPSPRSSPAVRRPGARSACRGSSAGPCRRRTSHGTPRPASRTPRAATGCLPDGPLQLTASDRRRPACRALPSGRPPDFPGSQARSGEVGDQLVESLMCSISPMCLAGRAWRAAPGHAPIDLLAPPGWSWCRGRRPRPRRHADRPRAAVAS